MAKSDFLKTSYDVISVTSSL